MNPRILLIFITFLPFHTIKSQVFQDLSALQCDSLIKANTNNPNFVILDVRTPGEYIPDHLIHAIERNYYDADFEQQLDALIKDKIYLIHCKSGGRSGNTLPIMKKLGFKEVYNMLGGMNAWKRHNYPTTAAFSEVPRWVSDSVSPLKSIRIGQVDTVTFVITNRGNAPLNLQSLHPLPMPFSTDFYPDTTIKGAMDYTFHIYYQPSSEGKDSLYSAVSTSAGDLHLQFVRKAVSSTSTSRPFPISIECFPNPSAHFIHLRGIPSYVKNITICTLNGIRIKNYPIQMSSIDLDISSLPKGYYLITIGLQERILLKE